MTKFLGSEVVAVENTPFKDYTEKEWALYFITAFGGFDGTHHKDWVLDQAARVLNGTKVEIKLAKWSDGQEEYRVTTCEPSDQYNDWVADLKNGEDGPDTYSYSEGIAP